MEVQKLEAAFQFEITMTFDFQGPEVIFISYNPFLKNSWRKVWFFAHLIKRLNDRFNTPKSYIKAILEYNFTCKVFLCFLILMKILETFIIACVSDDVFAFTMQVAANRLATKNYQSQEY